MVNSQRKGRIYKLFVATGVVFIVVMSVVIPSECATLTQRLFSKDGNIHYSAIKELDGLNVESKKKLVPDISRRLKDKDYYIRGCAASILGRIGPPAQKAIPALIKTLKDKDSKCSTRCYAAEALGKMGPPAQEAIPALIETLKEDKNWSVRESAIVALAMMGPLAQEAIPALIETLKKDKDSRVRKGAAIALRRIGYKKKK